MNNKGQRQFGYFAELDGLRAFAVIFVMLAHANFQLGENGWIGVDIFFALSGFLITSILLQEYRCCGKIDLKKFYLRRVLRLYPALLLMLSFVTVLVWNLFPDRWNLYFEELVASMLYIYNISWYWGLADKSFILFHMWSLGVEEQYYLIWPFFLVSFLKLLNKMTILLQLFIVLALIFLFRSSFISLQFFNSVYYDSIVFGSILVFLKDKYELKFLISRFLLFFSFSLLVFLSIYPLQLVSVILQNGFRGLFGLISCILILNLVYSKYPSILHELLSSKVFVFVGKISYSLYLWHVPVFMSFRLISPFEPYQNFILKFVVTFGLASVSYFFVERQFIRYSKYKFSIRLYV